MNRKHFTWLLGLAALLRLLFIWTASLWYDENFTLLISRLPFERFWQALLGDVHPPLYYLLVRPFALLEPAPWILRLPSVLFSLAALWLAWKIFDSLEVPPRIASAALILMAILPTQLWFAQEARMYALLEMLVLLAIYALLTKRWALMGVANLLLLYTQNYALFYIAIFALIVLILGERKGLMACVLPGLAWLPWAFVLLGQMHNLTGKYWITATYQGVASSLIVFPQLFFGPTAPGAWMPFAWLVLFAALIAGVACLLRERPAHWLGMLLLAFGPMLLGMLASALWQPVMLYRPLLGVMPFLCLVVAWPLGRIDSTRAHLYLACFYVPVLLANVFAFYTDSAAIKGMRVDDALAYVKANWQKGDLIIHTGDGSLVNLLPYAGLPQIRTIDCEPALGSLSAQTRDALPVTQATVDQVLNTVRVTHGRLWVFAQHTPLDPKCLAPQFAPLMVGAPAFVIDHNEYIDSGVWLINDR